MLRLLMTNKAQLLLVYPLLKSLFKIKKIKAKRKLAEDLGKEIAKRSIKKGIKEVAFDKGKYKYHGIIKILAEAARAGGLDF